MSNAFDDPILQTLQALALSLPETSETGACVRRSFKIRGKKSFLFLGEKDDEISVMVKLGDSLSRAEALVDRDGPARVSVGKSQWVTVKLPPGHALDAGLLEAWVRESFRNQAPKAVLAALDG